MLPKAPRNTGAQTPLEGQAPLREGEHGSPQILGFVDYVSCTFASCSLEELTDFLGGQWYWQNRTRNGYQRVLRSGGTELWCQGRSDMGLNLVVKGAGCRELKIDTITGGWRVFLGNLLAKGARFSRLDIAIDDHTGLLNMEEIGRCRNEGLVCSRFKRGLPYDSKILASEGFTPSGYNFGSRESETMVRIYDKAMKQGTEKHHVRVELETKGSKAKKLAKELSEKGESVIPGVIYRTLDFKVKGRGSVSHRYRWETQPWWSEFLGKAKKIRLSTAPGERTLEKSMKALSHQYGMTMAKIEDEYGSDKLLAIAAEGRIRLEQKRFIVKKSRDPRRKAC